MSESGRIGPLLKFASPSSRTNSIIAALILTAVLPVLYYAARPSGDPMYWPGRYLLRISPGVDERILIDDLERSGIGGVLGASNTTVSYMKIPDIERLAVADIDRVLPFGDPRRDRWISAVNRLFRSGDSALLFIPADIGVRPLARILTTVPAAGDAVLMDRPPAPDWRASLLFAAVAVFLILALERPFPRLIRLPVLLPAAVLLLFIPRTAMAPLLAAFALSPSGAWNHWKRRSLIAVIALMSGYVASVAALFAATGGAHRILAAAALGAVEIVSLLLPAGAAAAEAPARGPAADIRGKSPVRLRRRDHRLFEPIPLLSVPRPAIRFRKSIIPAALAVLSVLLTVLVPARSTDEHPPVPYAGAAIGKFENFASLHALEIGRRSDSLPDFSLLLASTVHQEGFMYGAPDRLPLPGEVLAIHTYRDTGSSVSAVESVMARYDEAWLDMTARRLLDEGAGVLFRDAGGPAEVMPVTRIPVPVRQTAVLPYAILLTVAVTALALLQVIPARREPALAGSIIPSLTVRRRAQAA